MTSARGLVSQPRTQQSETANEHILGALLMRSMGNSKCVEYDIIQDQNGPAAQNVSKLAG